MLNSSNGLYEFGPFRLDPVRRVLWREGEIVPLRSKAFDTLLALLRSRGRVLEKDELLREVWGETIVEESGLTRNIAEVRRTLGERLEERRYIVTVPGRGYRFVAEVREVAREIELEIGPEIEADEEGVIEETRTVSRIISEEEVIEAEPAALDASPVAWLESAPPRRPLFRRKAIRLGRLGGELALMAIVAAGLFFYFSRRPALTEKDSILLADFVNTTGDAAFDGTLKQGLAVQLEQSPFLNIFSEARTRETLRMMQRQPDESLTLPLAREICLRHGIKAALSGAIAALGSHYVITLEAINAQTGDVIARAQTEAAGKERVLRELSNAARDLRERLGESLGSLQKFHAPIEQASTASLAALQVYSLGRAQVMQGNRAAALRFYQRAVELDPDFAIAWNALAALQSHVDAAAALASINKAYALRDRASEMERWRITLTWHEMTTGDLDKLIEEAELWKQNYPHSWRPYWSLANSYAGIGQNEKALAHARELVRLDPYAADHHLLLAELLGRLDRSAEAGEVCLQMATLNFKPARCFHGAGLSAPEAAAPGSGADEFNYQDTLWQAGNAAQAGQWQRAWQLSRQGAELARRNNSLDHAALLTKNVLVAGALFGVCKKETLPDEPALATSPRLEWRVDAALAQLWCGQAAPAEAFIEQQRHAMPRHTLLHGLYLPTLRAALALQRAEPEQTLTWLKETDRFAAAASNWSVWLRGQAYLHKQDGATAAAAFQQIIAHRGWYLGSPLHPLAHLGLARALALTADQAKSREAYQRFFTLWKDADADLPVLTAARQEYEKLR